MQPPTDREACAALVHGLYRALDTHDYLGMDSFFTPGARMTRLGEILAGLPAIAAALAQRPAALRTRHLVSNLLIDGKTEGVGLGRFTMMVVRAQAGPASVLPILVRSPWRVSDVDVHFERSAQGWRIASLSTASQFEFDPALQTEAAGA